MKKIFLFITVAVGLFGTSCSKSSNSAEEESGENIDLGPSLVAVDIGLSVLWCSSNIGAVSPTDYGDYYAWAETEPKEEYTWATYKWCNGDSEYMTKYCYMSGYGHIDNINTIRNTDDVATVTLGSRWRIPTYDDFGDLIETRSDSNYKWEWKKINGHRGWLVTYLVNGNRVFFPAAGGWGSEGKKVVGVEGHYWTSSIFPGGHPGYAYFFGIEEDDVYRWWAMRSAGYSIRPICRKD